MAIEPDEIIRADDFINEGERDMVPANDAGRVVKLESNGTIHEAFLRGGFGDGSDGDVAISTPTTLTRDMYYDNLVVDSTLTTDGYRIFVRNRISGSGTIKWGTPNAGGNGVTDGDGGTGGIGASPSGTGPLKNVGGANGGDGRSNAGSTGGVPGNSPDADMNGDTATECLGNAAADGGRGGRGAPSGNGANYQSGGQGGDATEPYTPFGTIRALTAMMMDLTSSFSLAKLVPAPKAAGGGYGGDGTTSFASGSGAGAGASGGIIFIAARLWEGTFTIENRGGDGGDGSNSNGGSCGGGGGGAGGNGGINVFIYAYKTWTGSHDLAGGEGGAPGTGGENDAEAGEDGTTGVAYEINLFHML